MLHALKSSGSGVEEGFVGLRFIGLGCTQQKASVQTRTRKTLIIGSASDMREGSNIEIASLGHYAQKQIFSVQTRQNV